MKKKKKIALAAAVFALVAVAFTAWSRLPQTVYVTPDSSFNYAEGLLTARPLSAQSARTAANPQVGDSWNASLLLFDTIPLKSVRVLSIERSELIPCGVPFGIKLFSKGVLVVGFSDVISASGSVCPARNAGLKLGDIIISIDGQTVSTDNAVSAAIYASEGAELLLSVVRGGAELSIALKPVYASDGSGYKAGMWVRDSTAGLGTATYIDPQNNIVAGLGHAVADTDTGVVVPLLSGQLVRAAIVGVVKGVSGRPGELKGAFTGSTIAQLLHNGETGVFGELTTEFHTANAVPIALKHEVTVGAAHIITTINGSVPQAYSVRIEKVFLSDNAPTQNFIIRITDRTLLAATGGIVQGMSGSPVIQYGRLVGAVTHVFVNDPTRGYGIFVENMLATQTEFLRAAATDYAA